MEKLSPVYFRFKQTSTDHSSHLFGHVSSLVVKVLQNLTKKPQTNKPQHPPYNLHFIIEHSLYRFNKLFMEKAILLLDPGVLGSLHVKDLTLHNQSSRITVILYLTQIA